jgi:hypothetical protein
MHKERINAGLVVILAASFILAACGQKTPVAPTVDANAIYTQAAATVQAGLDQTESSKPTATQAPATSTPTMIALNNATNTPQPGANLTPGTPGTPAVATTPGAGTPGALVPTFTKPAVASTIVNTGDKAEWVSQDPADGTTVHKGNDLTVKFTIKNTGTKTWTTAYTFRFYAGDRMNAPSDLNMTKEVKPNDTITFTFAVNIPNRTGDTNTIWVVTNPDGLNFYSVTLRLNVID